LPVIGSQSLPISDFDFTAAEKQLQGTAPLVRTSLHEAELAKDGTRGYGLPAPNVRRVATPNPPPPPFTTAREWATYYQYCGWDAIVRATYIDSTPVLSGDKTLIYSVSHFSVEDTIKSDVPFKSSQHLVVYRVGGEVEDGGEKLRVDTPDMAAFKAGKSYLLILRRDKNASTQQYSIPNAQTIVVTNDQVYPISGKYAWLSGMDAFASGETYAALRDNFIKVHTLKSCT
jgi:hypothetical protein